MNCSCKGCGARATTRIQGALNPLQKEMLGYFCRDCIKKECTDECRNRS